MALNQLQKAILGEFSPGQDYPSQDPAGPGIHTAGIDIQTASNRDSIVQVWWSQIEIHGASEADAKALREFVLAAIKEKTDRMMMHEFSALA